MTAKRFTTKNIICSNYCVWDNNDKPYGNDEVVDVLNTLHEENEQLKFQLQNTSDQMNEFHRGARENANRVGKLEKENEQLKQFQDTVFVLINEMIETANYYRTPIKSLDYGDDLGYWNGVYQKLKELKKILEKEKGDVE